MGSWRQGRSARFGSAHNREVGVWRLFQGHFPDTSPPLLSFWTRCPLVC